MTRIAQIRIASPMMIAAIHIEKSKAPVRKSMNLSLAE